MYLKTISLLSFSLLALVVGFNYMANPFGIYDPPVIQGFNNAHPAATAYSRLEKFEAVKRVKPDAIVTGTSRADIGMNPKPEFFPGLKVYDFGLPASSIHEQDLTLQFAEAVHPLKEAVITLDKFSFNALKLENKEFNPKMMSPAAARQPKAFLYSLRTLFTLDTVVAAIKNIRYLKHLDRHSYTLPNGHTVVNDIWYQVRRQGARAVFGSLKADLAAPHRAFSTTYPGTHGRTTYDYLKEMLDLARRKHIKVILLISPLHFMPWQHPTAEDKAWKEGLIAVDEANAKRWHAKPYPLWDFDERNSFTMEKVPPAGDKTRMKWFINAGHGTPALGDIVFRRIFGLPSKVRDADFGRRLL